MSDNPQTFANPEVLAFYKTLPFNIRESVESSVDAIRSQDPVIAYPVLKTLLSRNASVLDVGCGAGWFSNAVNHHYGCDVTGIDFNSVAVTRAKEVAASLNLDTKFEVADLFLYRPEHRFDLVVSLGVLHHTDNCQAAVHHVCENFVRPGGHVLIGLYHKDGRAPFLNHFRELKERGISEDELLQHYKQLSSHLTDETLLRSWFRDQVLHPHESQHTLEEMIPIIERAGMELVSTSVNRFGPIDSLPSLFEEERKLRDTGQQRLRDGQYFTGYFVFLARKKENESDGAGKSSREVTLPATSVFATKPYIEFDQDLGYRYRPNVDLQLPRPGGGYYHFQTNSIGIRGSREYSLEKPPETYRILVCGDSMPAGQYISNDQRFTEILERRLPNTEVINLALEGSGTDQQLLLYEDMGKRYEHDAVLVMPFLSNIRRNLLDARVGYEPKTGAKVLRGKPRFELVEGRLELRRLPSTIQHSSLTSEEGEAPQRTDNETNWSDRLKTRLSQMPGASVMKKIVYSVVPWEPFPEYRSAQSYEWRLMEAILKRFKTSAGDRPLIIAPTFYDNYVRYRMARNYWQRFASLANIPGVDAIDLLPHFKRPGTDGARCFQAPYDMHFSAYGHLVLAEALLEEFSRRSLLASR